jgi:DNA-binding response OmpR family regulator
MSQPGASGDWGGGLVPDAGPPEIDDLGVVRFGGRWLALSPTQESIVRCLVRHFGRPVTRADVAAETWPDGPPDLHTIDVHIHRLRPRLRRLGLVIHTLRGRGFLLDTPTAAVDGP